MGLKRLLGKELKSSVAKKKSSAKEVTYLFVNDYGNF